MAVVASSTNHFSSLLCACVPFDRGELHTFLAAFLLLCQSITHSFSFSFSQFTIRLQSHSYYFLKNVGVVVRAATSSRFSRLADFAVYLGREGGYKS